LRNMDIYYGGIIARRSKEDPVLPKKLEALGWVLRPDHPDKGTYSRDKEIRTYYDGQYGYIYNNCYREDGLETGPLGVIVPYPDASMNAMKTAQSEDMSVKDRYEFYLLRASEELYDWTSDPGGWHNLAGDPEYLDVLENARKRLLQWMMTSGDPLADDFQTFINDN